MSQEQPPIPQVVTDTNGNPVTWVERPTSPKVGEMWLLPNGTLRVFCEDRKWWGVWVNHPTKALYELPPEEQ